MSKCANCGTMILFGGKKHGSLTFCGDGCFHQGVYLREALAIPDEVVEQVVREFHEGECPVCGGPGPVDFHFSHRVMSFLVITQFQTIPRISCSGCGMNAKIWNSFVTFGLGWWGVPFGIALTPVYLARNLFGLLSSGSLEPSQHLKDHVKLMIAQQALEQQAVAEAQGMEA